MEKIEKWLTENGWIVHTPYSKYGTIGANNDVCTIFIGKQDERFYVRSALLTFFDRWANSGSEEILDTEDGVILYMSRNYLEDALSEVSYMLVEEDYYNGNHDNVKKLVDFVYNLLN